jgi:hypothetical protein
MHGKQTDRGGKLNRADFGKALAEMERARVLVTGSHYSLTDEECEYVSLFSRAQIELIEALERYAYFRFFHMWAA